MARYLWNGALCGAIAPSLHCLEVCLRNYLYKASGSVNMTGRTYGSVKCWLDATPTFLMKNEESEVRKAKERLGTDLKYHTPGRLIGKLGFGFWTALFWRPYEHGRKSGPQLWPRLIPKVFPFVPKQFADREKLSVRLDSIREFRNRIAHHEPIWDRNLLVQHSGILEMIGWMNPNLQMGAQAVSDVVRLHHVGPGQFRIVAAKLLDSTV